MAHQAGAQGRAGFSLSRAYHRARYSNTSLNMMALETFTTAGTMKEHLEVLAALGLSAADYDLEPWISLHGAVQLASAMSLSQIGVRTNYNEIQK